MKISLLKSFRSPVDETCTFVRHVFKICTQSCRSYIRSAKFVLYKFRGETGENLIESKKIDVHGMPNSREKTGKLHARMGV